VVPVGVDTFGWSLKNRRPLAVAIGEPMVLNGFPSGGKGYKEATALIEAEVTRLWHLAAQAVADGLPDQLRDATPREPEVRLRDGERPSHKRAWPTEPWAAEPLGPLYKAIT